MADAFFNRHIAFGLVPKEETYDSAGFDSYPVEAEERLIRVVSELRGLLNNLDDFYMNMPAPEEAAQTEADYVSSQLASILEGWRRG
jgi:hypothetical protein